MQERGFAGNRSDSDRDLGSEQSATREPRDGVVVAAEVAPGRIEGGWRWGEVAGRSRRTTDGCRCGGRASRAVIKRQRLQTQNAAGR